MKNILSGRSGLALSVAGLLLAGAFPAAASETKGFVVNWFYDASYFGGDEDCPTGTNISAIDFYRRDLAHAGYSHDEIEAALKDFPGEGGLKQPWVPMVMTRGNRKDNVYINPTTEADPGLKEVKGRFGYGMDLDGKAATSPIAFEDPETHQKVENQMYRSMGCIRSYRGLPNGRPSLAENLWDVLRDVMPAWLITVSSPDSLSKDGEVTVTIDRALNLITRDASGSNAQADLSYQVDPDPRFHNVMHGHIKNGVVTSDPADVTIVADPYIMPVYEFTKAQVRFNLKPDGTMKGIIAGYQPVDNLYYSMSNQSYIKEYAASIDVPALYYSLKRNADYDPDPKTGQNRKISSSYMIEAVPAYVVQPQAKTAQATQAGGAQAR